MKLLAFFIGIVLTGCITTTGMISNQEYDNCFNTIVIKDHKLVPEYCKTKKEKRTFNGLFFSIIVPGNVFNLHGNTGGDTWLTIYKNNTPNPAEEIESAIHILPDTQFTCTPFALGVSKLQERELEGTKVWTGRVDVFDYSGYIHNYPHEENGLLPCRPPVIGYAPLPEGAPEGSMEGGKSSFAYALCSEKDGKRVVVCIQQMTDNPALAEEIFSTFKWTE